VKLIPEIPGESLQPIVLMITNTRDEQGVKLPSVGETFNLVGKLLPKSEPFYLLETGQILAKNARKQLERHIRTCIKRGTSPHPVARLLIDTIHGVAKTNTTVGSNLLVASIPRRSISADTILYSNRLPNMEEASFLYIPQVGGESLQYS